MLKITTKRRDSYYVMMNNIPSLTAHQGHKSKLSKEHNTSVGNYALANRLELIPSNILYKKKNIANAIIRRYNYLSNKMNHQLTVSSKDKLIRFHCKIFPSKTLRLNIKNI